jgi:hypothetical protein
LGISPYGERIAFGAHDSTTGYTICGKTTPRADSWRHVAVTRRTGGAMRISANGNPDRRPAGSTGNVSYRVGHHIANGWVNAPFLVTGAEKHDDDPKTYPSVGG